MHSRRIRFLLLHLLPLRGLSLTGDLRSEQEEYAENVYIYNIINSATALANASRQDVGEGHAAIKDISVGFGVDRQRFNVVCTELPGVVVYTDPAMEDEANMDSMLDGNYGAQTLTQNERIHYGDLKNRYRQRRDRTRQLVAQLFTLNTRQNLNPTEVRLLGRTLSKDDIRKYSKFETLATTICDQQDALESLRRRYDEQVTSSSAQLAHLSRSHEARIDGPRIKSSKGAGRRRKRSGEGKRGPSAIASTRTRAAFGVTDQ